MDDEMPIHGRLTARPAGHSLWTLTLDTGAGAPHTGNAHVRPWRSSLAFVPRPSPPISFPTSPPMPRLKTSISPDSADFKANAAGAFRYHVSAEYAFDVMDI